MDGVPDGPYAVKLFHDENSNEELDMGWMGAEERYGISNDARGLIGPPEISEFLQFEPHPLSLGATSGFWSRLKASTLRRPVWFEDRLKAHIQAMSA